MNIEHIRAAREALERELLKLFCEFKGKTGLAVVDCEVVTIRVSNFDAPDTVAATQVVVELEQI